MTLGINEIIIIAILIVSAIGMAITIVRERNELKALELKMGAFPLFVRGLITFLFGVLVAVIAGYFLYEFNA